MVQLKINTQIKEYPDDITWQVIADEYQSGYSDEILLVQVNGKLQELQEKIRHFTQWQVLKMWKRSLWIFLLEKVFL